VRRDYIIDPMPSTTTASVTGSCAFHHLPADGRSYSAAKFSA
jgi:hypothetical protein